MGVGIPRCRDYDFLLCGIHDFGRCVHDSVLRQGKGAKQLDEGVSGHKLPICSWRRVCVRVDGDTEFALSDEADANYEAVRL